MFSPLRCLFVVVSSVVVCRAVDVALCDRSLCDCLQPNGQIGDTVKVYDGSAFGCFCTCGREEGQACSDDEHCAKGTACAYPKDLSRSGYQLVCTSRCALRTCDKYQRCTIDDNFQPVCNPRSFDCDPSVVANVVAVRGNTKQTFTNECMKANANYDLLVQDMTADTWNDVS